MTAVQAVEKHAHVLDSNTRFHNSTRIKDEAIVRVVYLGRCVTMYPSRAPEGYEINIDGKPSNLVEVACIFNSDLARFLDTAASWRKL